MSARPFETWLFGKWGPLEKAIAVRIKEMVWPEGALCCACGRVTDGDGLCPACRESLRYDGAFMAWDETEPEPGLTAWSLRPHDGIARELVLRPRGPPAAAPGASAQLQGCLSRLSRCQLRGPSRLGTERSLLEEPPEGRREGGPRGLGASRPSAPSGLRWGETQSLRGLKEAVTMETDVAETPGKRGERGWC